MTQKKNTSEVAVIKNSPLHGLAAKFNLEPAKLLEVLKATVIKPDSKGKQATNEEVAAFCIVAQQYALNPFTREIHAFANGGSVVPIVGIDGWTHIVNASGNFDGCEFDYLDDDEGKPISITCRMYVKNRSRPIEATEYYSECYRPTAPWNQMPRRMLRHKSYIQAARYAFGLSGIYDEDEGRDIIQNKSMIIEREPVEMPAVIESGEKAPETSPKSKADQPDTEEWVCAGCGVVATRPSPYCESCGLYKGEDPETGKYAAIEKGQTGELNL